MSLFFRPNKPHVSALCFFLRKIFTPRASYVGFKRALKSVPIRLSSLSFFKHFTSFARHIKLPHIIVFLFFFIFIDHFAMFLQKESDPRAICPDGFAIRLLEDRPGFSDQKEKSVEKYLKCEDYNAYFSGNSVHLLGNSGPKTTKNTPKTGKNR